VTEHSFVGTLAADPSLSLEAVFRVAEASPVVRFRYTFRSARPARMTKSAGTDALTYLALSLAGLPLATEVRLSEFLDTVHSYCPSARPIGSEQFEAGLALFGPILVAGDGGHTLLIAYEHGSQVPDAFLEYRLDRGRGAALSAVKGNYHAGRPLSPESPYETIWFHFAAADCGQDELAMAYRDFLLRHQSPNAASRQPQSYRDA
jgi:alpha-galactosidase